MSKNSKNNEFYFVLYSNTSRYSVQGLQPRVTWMTGDQIIEEAQEELMRQGRTFEDMAGIEMIDVHGDESEFKPERELTRKELLELAEAKLDDDGRLFVLFPADKEGSQKFLEEADYYYLRKQALDVITEFSEVV